MKAARRRWVTASLAVWLGIAACAPSSISEDWKTLLESLARTFPNVPVITTEELATALEASGRPVILLDARTPEEYAVSHLPGARLASTAEEARPILDPLDAEALIVVYCSVGYRSAALVQRLQEQGVRSVVNLEGSIFKWANEGRPVYREGARVTAVHPYDAAWGRLLAPAYWSDWSTARDD